MSWRRALQLPRLFLLTAGRPRGTENRNGANPARARRCRQRLPVALQV